MAEGINRALEALALVLAALVVGVVGFYAGALEWLAAGAAAIVIWRWIGGGRRTVVFLYLMSAGAASVYFACRLWMTDFHKDPCKVEALGSSGAASPVSQEGSTATSPVIESLTPPCLAIGGNHSTVTLIVRGLSAEPPPVVLLDGAERQSRRVGDKQLTFGVHASDFGTERDIPVTLRAGNVESAPVNLKIISAGDVMGIWTPFPGGKPMPINKEVQLLLLVIAAGCLGASVAGIKSYVDYSGEKKLCECWYPLYLANPALGIGLALTFYVVIRGGFLAGTAADIHAVNPFGLLAIGAMAGMFHDKALLKLSEVFETLFQSKDSRTGKLEGLKILTPNVLPNASVGKRYELRLTASGGKTITWTSVTPPPAGLAVKGDRLEGEPSGPGGTTELTVQAVNESGNSDTKSLLVTVA